MPLSSSHHRLRHVLTPTLVALLATHAASAQPTPPTVEVVSGVAAGGGSTERWSAILRARLSPPEYDSVAAVRRAMTGGESAWAALIESRRAAWARQIPTLAMPFSPARPPARTLIVLGNRGGSDAFAHDSATIGFDLAQLQANYGAASEPRNADLIDRLFRHEYTHVMQKAWVRLHPWRAESPLQTALADIWLEGQGNYYSLSERWRGQDGRRTEAARVALSELEPRFVVRLSALACASPERVPSLRQGLSSGRFDQKWGALPVALWIDDERPASAAALRNLVVAGPSGVWDLAARHLPEPLRHALAEARAVESACAAAGPEATRGRP